jgi:hypothetical protein
MFERLVSYRYRLLPPAFLIGLGFPSFVERTYKMDVVLSAITALVLFTAWLALWPHKRVRWLGFVLMVAAIATMTVHNLTDRYTHATALLTAVFLALVTVVLFLELLNTDQIDLDALLAAVSIYLLTAVLWAALYMLVAVRFENSFAYASQIVLQEFDPVAIAQGLRMDDFYYYSVTTLTTAGLGDISPVTDPAQFLTALEALVGQLFLVVFVAHLVGLRIALRVAGRSAES